MRELVWTQRAKSDLSEIADYIAVEKQNPDAAERMLEDFLQRSEIYAREPALGTLHDDLESPSSSDAIRSFRVKSYLVFYRETQHGILVLRVLHGRRDYRSLF